MAVIMLAERLSDLLCVAAAMRILAAPTTGPSEHTDGLPEHAGGGMSVLGAVLAAHPAIAAVQTRSRRRTLLHMIAACADEPSAEPRHLFSISISGAWQRRTPRA